MHGSFKRLAARFLRLAARCEAELHSLQCNTTAVSPSHLLVQSRLDSTACSQPAHTCDSPNLVYRWVTMLPHSLCYSLYSIFLTVCGIRRCAAPSTLSHPALPHAASALWWLIRGTKGWFVATRDIQPGELLTVSYLSGKLSMQSHQARCGL